MNRKIHYHSDCQFFAGCENMLVNFFESKELKDKYKLSFSYRDSLAYREGLYSRVKSDISYFPLNLPYFKNLRLSWKWEKYKIGRIITIIRMVTNYPILIYEVYILIRLFLMIKPDIVHINSGGYPPTMSAKAAVIASHLCGIKKTLLVVNNLAKEYDNLSRILDYPLDRALVRGVDYFLTGSMAATKRLKNVLSLNDDKALNIHNGIRLRDPQESIRETRERLNIKKGQVNIFGVVALLIPRKGHRILIDAIELIVKASVTDFIVLIEGSGPLKSELERDIQSRKLCKYCKFVGNEDNIVDFILAVDFVVLPSIKDEDFPNVILESMGLGRIVLASNLAGIPEQILDKNTGFLFTPGDFKSLSNLMVEIIVGKVDVDQMKLSSKKHFETNFTEVIAVRKYIDFYDFILGE